MVKKKFIDKRHSVTYNLVFRSTETADDVPERVLVDAEKGVGVGKVDEDLAAQGHDATAAAGRRYAPGHPLAWLEEQEHSAPVSEERRRELVELGFPDDGYDYLRHMRAVGWKAAAMETTPAAVAAANNAALAAAADAEAASVAATAAAAAAPGPSVYVPAPIIQAPEEDRRLIDASGLTVMQGVQEEQEAAAMMGGVTAFSREKSRVHGLEKRELAEMEAMMLELEEDEEYGDAEGAGDLLDDFVLAATEFGPEAAAEEQQQRGGGGASAGVAGDHQQGEGSSPAGSEDEYSEVESGEEEGSSYAGSEEPGVNGSQGGKPPARPGSIASTYWRDERTDRKNLLTVIDERFEHLALEYDDDEIGELEEQGDQIRGFADVAEFDNLLDEFLEAHGQSQTAHEGNVAYSAPKISQVGKEMEFFGLDDADAGIAIQKAHEALRRAEQQPEEEESGRRERGPTFPEFQAREQWDCESVLSLRSNLDNHPGSICEPRSIGSRRRSAASSVAAMGAGGIIRLNRDGIPMGVLPQPRRGMGSAAEAGGSGRQEEQNGAGSADGEEEDGSADGSSNGGAAGPLFERKKGETAEEKKARKTAVKEAKRSARTQKKELRTLFKGASVQAQRRAATAQPQAALHLPS